MINLVEYELIGAHWRALYVNGINRRASYDAIYLIALELNIFQKKLKNS